MTKFLPTILTSFFIFSNSQSIAQSNIDYKVESKMHYRYSEENRYAVNFPFPPEALPIGESTAFVETVDAGEHVDLSVISLAGRWQPVENFSVTLKLDIVDKYDRNPVSSDYKTDIDNLYLRYGKSFPAAKLPDSPNAYIQLGKFSKFERQQERRTESYGLVSTAFNRFEDSGFEIGFDSPAGFYAKASYTTGNPVFMRDPNMLAGENGTDQTRVPPANPDPEFKSGIVILYDAEIEKLNLSDAPEAGLGLGYRWETAQKDFSIDILAFGYERELAEERSLHGTFYGADLDLLDLGEVPGAEGIRLPVENNDKQEVGVNLWVYASNFALFAQYVDQNIGGLIRTGSELELSYVFDLPVKVTPVLRYSNLNNKFVGSSLYPAPSVWWDWQKIDYAVNVDFNDSLRMIIEYADNTFQRNGKDEDNNETLITFVWRYQ